MGEIGMLRLCGWAALIMEWVLRFLVPLSWFTGRKYAENAVEPTYASYVVQSGDSLWKIAKNLLGGR